MAGLQRRDDGLLLQFSAEEFARIDAMAELLGLNGLMEDSVGAVLGRPVRIAVLDASLLARQFWLLLTTVAPGWELVAAAASVEELLAQLQAEGHPGADVVLANPTGLYSSCLLTCQATPDTCPLIGKQELLASLPPVLLDLREGDSRLALPRWSGRWRG